MGQVPMARVAQTCRSAAIEMPRPTVRKWCEHGYTVAYDKTKVDLATHFKPAPVEEEAPVAEEAAVAKEEVKPAESDAKVIATIPITLNDSETFDLVVRDGQNVEDAVVIFCRENVQSDVSACIRQLLPDVLERFNGGEGNTGLRGGA
jgi:hypothetical protein